MRLPWIQTNMKKEVKKMIGLLEFEYLIILIIYGGYLLLEYYPNQKLSSDLEHKVIKILNIAMFIAMPMVLMFIGFITV
jgi:hypothetical protein